jgi:ABC-2 type transport system permease protein
MIAGTLPFCAMGLAIGYYSTPNSAPAVVNILFLPLAFCSGLWLPVQMLPKFLQHIAPFLPPYHLGQLALQAVGFNAAGNWTQHVLALAAFTVAFLLLAQRGFKRDDVSINA